MHPGLRGGATLRHGRSLTQVLQTVTGGEDLSTYSESSAEDEEGETNEEEEKCQTTDPRKCLEEVLATRAWNASVMSVIALSTFTMALQCNSPLWPGWRIIEQTFLVLFTLEILIRLYVHRFQFFLDLKERGWNIFELFVVLAGLLETLLSSVVHSSADKLMLMLRTFRVVRILRSCRLIKHFKQLYLLVQGFTHSLQAVFWIAVLFCFVVLIAGIVCTTLLGNHAEMWNEGPDGEEDMKAVKKYFGTLTRSMVTMFQMVTLDDWADICNLISKKLPWMTVFFIAYVLVAAFAMVALLTGVMTEHVNSVSLASMKVEEEKRFVNYVETLQYVFQQHERPGDAAGEGEGLTFAEFCELLETPKVAREIHLKQTEINHDDLEDIFRCLDLSGDGRVSWQEFKQGLKWLQGPASAKQLSLLRAEVYELLRRVGERVREGEDPGAKGAAGVQAACIHRLAALDERVGRMEAVLRGLAASAGPAAGAQPVQVSPR